MNDERPTKGRSETAGRRPIERSTLEGLQASHSWERADAEIEVRARIVVALDALEDGNLRMAELALFELLDDLDGVEAILAPAKRAA